MGRHVSAYASALASSPQAPEMHAGEANGSDSGLQNGLTASSTAPADDKAVQGLAINHENVNHAADGGLAPSEVASPTLTEPAPTAESIRQGILQASHVEQTHLHMC